MDSKRGLVLVAGILSALLETGGSPESNLYILCDMDMTRWETIRYILVESGLVTIKGYFVTLTAKGKETAESIDAVLANK